MVRARLTAYLENLRDLPCTARSFRRQTVLRNEQLSPPKVPAVALSFTFAFAIAMSRVERGRNVPITLAHCYPALGIGVNVRQPAPHKDRSNWSGPARNIFLLRSHL